MSASYVVFRTPDSLWNTLTSPLYPLGSPAASPRPASHAFDDRFAEDPVRPDHQRDDHQEVGREVLGAAAYVRVHVAGRHVLDDPDHEPAHDGAGNRVEAAQDHHREDLEAHQGQVGVHPEEAAPHDAAQGGDHARHGPGEREVALYVDAHRHGYLLVVGDRPHRDALAALEEEPPEGAQEQDAHRGPQELDGRHEQWAPDERLVADGQVQAPGLGPPQDPAQPAHSPPEAHCRPD